MNSITINGKSLIVNDDTITVDGKDYEIPKHIRSRFGNSSSIIGGKIYINEYRFYPKTGKWSISYLKFIKYGKILMWIGIIVGVILLINWVINHIHIV